LDETYNASIAIANIAMPRLSRGEQSKGTRPLGKYRAFAYRNDQSHPASALAAV